MGDACCSAKVEQSKGQYGWNETSENDKVREMPETDPGWGVGTCAAYVGLCRPLQGHGFYPARWEAMRGFLADK